MSPVITLLKRQLRNVSSLRFSRCNRVRIIGGLVKESGAFLLDNSLSVTIDLPLGGVKCSKSVWK